MRNLRQQAKTKTKKCEGINNVEKDLQVIRVDRQMETQLDSLGEALKNVPNRKTPIYDVIHGNCFKKNSLPSTTD